jgi:hypothetical protein
MRVVGLLSGGAPVVKRYQIPSTISVDGIPVVASAAGAAGPLSLATTTAANDLVGITLTTATYGTAQNSDGTDPAALVEVIINPDAVIHIDMSGDGTTGTALADQSVSTASTDGLAITTGASWTSTEYDEGSVWGVSGSNVGVLRKITSTSATAGTVTVAFPQDTAVNDVYHRASVHPMANQTITLTSDLDAFNAAAGVATNTAEFQCIELTPNDWIGNAAIQPFALFVAQDHILNRES